MALAKTTPIAGWMYNPTTSAISRPNLIDGQTNVGNSITYNKPGCYGLQLSTAQVCTRFKFYWMTSYYPSAYIQGSNDGSTWINLSSAQTIVGGWNTHDFANINGYTYYRVYCNAAYQLACSEVEAYYEQGTNVLTVGALTPSNATDSTIDLKAAYSGDDNGSSSCVFRYRVDGATEWITWNGTISVDRTNRWFTTTITGLTPATTYEFQDEFTDADNVVGTNPSNATHYSTTYLGTTRGVLSASNVTASSADLSAVFTGDTNTNNACVISIREQGTVDWTDLTTVKSGSAYNASASALTDDTVYEAKAIWTDSDGLYGSTESITFETIASTIFGEPVVTDIGDDYATVTVPVICDEGTPATLAIKWKAGLREYIAATPMTLVGDAFVINLTDLVFDADITCVFEAVDPDGYNEISEIVFHTNRATVDPVSEYDGGKAQVFVFDDSDTVVAVLDSTTRSGCPFWNDLHVMRVDGLETYEFEMPAEHEVAEYVLEGNQIIIRDHRGMNHLLRIMTVDDSHSDSEHIKHIYSEVAANEMTDSIVRPVTFTGAPIATVLTNLLAPTRWNVGTVDWAGIIDISFMDYPTVLAAVRKVLEQAMLEMRYRVEYRGSRITGRYVDFVNRVGEDTGRVIEYSKDIVGITRTGTAVELATALIGLGAGEAGSYVNFTDEVWTVAGGKPVEKPADQDWVGHEAARERYGIPQADGSRTHRFGVVLFDDETSSARLLTRTYEALLDRCVPDYTYDIDMLLLDRAPRQKPWQANYKHEVINVGDTVTVRDLTYNPPLQVHIRATEVRRSYTDPTQMEVNSE